MIQLILHLFGDFILQSNWQAEGKTKASWPAFFHALLYSLPFLLIGSWRAVLVIFVTHFLIDRFRLARYLVFVKNLLFAPPFWRAVFFWVNDVYENTPLPDDLKAFMDRHCWRNCAENSGAPADQTAWLAVWLLIVADNTIHLLVNWLALSYL